jgi:hypothetical protein
VSPRRRSWSIQTRPAYVRSHTVLSGVNSWPIQSYHSPRSPPPLRYPVPTLHPSLLIRGARLCPAAIAGNLTQTLPSSQNAVTTDARTQSSVAPEQYADTLKTVPRRTQPRDAGVTPQEQRRGAMGNLPLRCLWKGGWCRGSRRAMGAGAALAVSGIPVAQSVSGLAGGRAHPSLWKTCESYLPYSVVHAPRHAQLRPLPRRLRAVLVAVAPISGPWTSGSKGRAFSKAKGHQGF